MKYFLLLLLLLLLVRCHKKALPIVSTKEMMEEVPTCCSHARHACDPRYKAPTLRDYIAADTNLSAELKTHFSNRNTLEAFEVVARTTDFVWLQSGVNTIVLQKEKVIPRAVYEMTFISMEDFGGPDSLLKTINGKEPLGWRHQKEGGATWQKLQQPVERVASLSLNDTYLNARALEHLLFPNFTDQYRSLRPVEAFWSEDRQFIYLYIFGQVAGDNLNEYDYNMRRYSYMAKVVIDVKKQAIKGLLPVKGFRLKKYNWFCEGFIGF